MEILEFTTQTEFETVLSSIKNPKHRCIALIMYDAGLRVSEVLALEWSDLDAKRKLLRVYSLKKRNQEKPKSEREHRTVPVSDRLYGAFAVYLESLKGSEKKNKLMFPGADGGTMDRTAINNMLRRIQYKQPQIGNLYPHKLRHSFATNLRANGAELEDIKDLLGHEQLDTTLIYAHADPARLRSIIEASQPKKSWLRKLKEKIVSPRKTKLNLIHADTSLLVGREQEVKQINDFLKRNISVILTGKAGVGKTHLLNSIKFEGKTLHLDDAKDFKKSLLNILLHLFDGDKEAAARLIYGTSERHELETKITRESVPSLCRLLISNTQKHEYVLIIADLDQVTESVVKALKILKEHFVIVTTAKDVKLKHSDFLWDFEKVELKPFARPDAMKLIYSLTADLEMEEHSFVYQKVWDTSEGNPKMITELCDRLQKEPIVNHQTADEICNSYLGRQLQQFDASMIFLLLFGSLVILRYIGRDTNRPELQMIGGMVMVVLLFGRYFFNSAKRRFV